MIRYNRYAKSDTKGSCAAGCGILLGILIVSWLFLIAWGIGITWIWNVLVPSLLNGPTLEIYQGIAIALGLSIFGTLLNRGRST